MERDKQAIQLVKELLSQKKTVKEIRDILSEINPNFLRENYPIPRKNIREFVRDKYVRFNAKMRSVAAQKFITCQGCKYKPLCAPCPLANPRGIVPECEWVKSQTIKLRKKILHSKIRLLLEPTKVGENKIKFTVATQKLPLFIPMSEERFKKLIISKFPFQGIKNNRTETKIIEFLCKLRSHRIIEIEGFDTFFEE